MKTPYHFKLIVPCHYEKEFKKFSSAKKFAEKTGEKVYLQIYLHKNKANEPYNELVISNETEIELAKLQLIASIQKYL